LDVKAVLLALVLAALLLPGCAIEEEPDPAQIQAEGCPEGQVSNAAGTECVDEDEVKAKHGPSEEVQREAAEEQVRRFEEGEPNPPSRLECQEAKAFLDRGEEGMNELAEEYEAMLYEAMETGVPVAETIEEFLVNRGYECTPPTPVELDKKYEKPADNPKQRAIQCGPQSNASPEFRKKYC